MKNNPASFYKSIIIILFILAVNPVFGIDLGFYGGAGNIVFDSDREKTLSEEKGKFNPEFFPLARASISGETGFVFFEGGFERNQILRNRLYGEIGIDLTFFKMSVGPFIGLFNSGDDLFNPGFSAAMHLGFPGIVFAEVNASSSLGNALGSAGSYTQKSGGFSAGFWVPHVVCSLNLVSQSYTEKKNQNLNAEDSIDRYFFRADVYTKNVPFTVKVDFGYALQKRAYYSQAIVIDQTDPLNIEAELVPTVSDDEFKFIYIGMEAVYTVNPNFKFMLSGEIPVYSWTSTGMKSPEKNTFLFQAMAGVIFSF